MTLTEQMKADGVADAVKQLRDNADCLRQWFDSVVANRREAEFYGGIGVELNARDALDCAFRLASSTVAALNQTADALERLATPEQPQ
jgi:hypothetical protein